MLNDTLLGLKTLAESATERSLVVWLNEYFGPISREGKDFNQMQVYVDNREKILAVVGIPQRSAELTAKPSAECRERKMTFRRSPAIGLSSCWRSARDSISSGGTCSNNSSKRR